MLNRSLQTSDVTMENGTYLILVTSAVQDTESVIYHSEVHRE